MSFNLESIKKNKEEVDKEVLISKDKIIEDFYESVRQNVSNERFEDSLQNLLIQNIQNHRHINVHKNYISGLIL